MPEMLAHADARRKRNALLSFSDDTELVFPVQESHGALVLMSSPYPYP
jgi:hypothetical protein